MAQPNEPASDAADPLAALTTALKLLMSNQAAINLKTPTFEWTTSDQYDEFKLFCESIESWLHLQAIPDVPNDKSAHLEYILSFLSTTGHQKWNQWTHVSVTTDDIAATKNMLTMYFSQKLGPSIVKLSTDHILFNYHICLSCLYMSVLLVYLQICYSTCTFIVYLRYMCLYDCHSPPGLHSCNHQCPLV